MRYLWTVLACLTVGLGTVGCGGGSSNNNSLITGRYVGGFTNTVGNSGELYLNINSAGIISAKGVNVSSESVTTLIGTTFAGGITSLTPTGGGITISGTLSLSSTSQLTGTLSDAVGDSITIKLNPALGGTAPSFAGAIAGSFIDGNGNSDIGTLTLIVDANGKVTGLLQDSSKSSTDTITGTITNGGLVSFTSSNGGGIITGTLTLAGSQVTGTLNNSKGYTTAVTLVLS